MTQPELALSIPPTWIDPLIRDKAYEAMHIVVGTQYEFSQRQLFKAAKAILVENGIEPDVAEKKAFNMAKNFIVKERRNRNIWHNGMYRPARWRKGDVREKRIKAVKFKLWAK